MKKILTFLSLVLACVMILSTLAACSPKQEHVFNQKKTTSEYFAEDATDTSAAKYYYSCKHCGEKSTETFEYGQKDSERAEVGSKAKETLDGKKILFAGCSYNYYGNIVIRKDNGVNNLSSRTNDMGYFYELCKQNGANVNVTNWCFGAHDLKDLLGTSCNTSGGACPNGFNHLEQLTDRNYDYVSLMDVGAPERRIPMEEYIEELKGFMKLFTDVNPDCKFIYSIPCGAYWYNHTDRTDFKEVYVGTVYAKEIAKLDNMIVMDWGRMIYDLIKGNATVPGSEFIYNEDSLIVGDGHHPNLLTGYINTLMTYCIITGETAVGQPINLESDQEGTSTTYKPFSEYANFLVVMNSPKEMAGIQKLIDRYIDMDTYLYY